MTNRWIGLRAPAWRLLSGSILALIFAARVLAADGDLKTFDVRQGAAQSTLRQFSRQAGVQLVFSTDAVKDVQTHAVSGRFSPLEALRKLLQGTPLKIVVDAGAPGAFAIRRDEPTSEKKTANPAADRPDAASDQVVQLAGYQVTASRDTGIVNQGVIPQEENQAMRFDIVGRSQIEQSGATSLSEYFYRQNPTVTSWGTGSQRSFTFAASFSNGFSTTSDALNLRGLGTIDTVTLVNGRRLYFSDNAGADISRFPIDAIDRIEIVPVSVSATYGADAIGGAVNVILRKNFQGAEFSQYFGTSTDGGGTEYHSSYYQGLASPDGKTTASISLSYSHKDDLLAGQRRYYDRALSALPPGTPGYLALVAPNFVGPLATVVSANNTGLGISANPTATYASVSGGSTGIGLTKASFAAGLAGVSDSREQRSVFIPSTDTYSAYLTLERRIFGEYLSAYAELGFSYSAYSAHYPGFMPAITLAAANPINPFGQSVRVYVDPIDLPDDATQSLQRVMRLVGGIKGAFADQRWKWSVDTSWDRTQSQSQTTDYLRFLAAAVNAGLYNPLRDLSTQTPVTGAQLNSFFARRLYRSHPTISAFDSRLNGELFSAPGGPAQISVGGELHFENQFTTDAYNYGSYSSLPGAAVVAPDLTATFRRDLAGFAEFELPLVSPANQIPLASEVEISAADRYDHYSDFGGENSPMAAVKYAPTRDLAFRASVSTGFVPPTVANLFTPDVTSAPVTVAFTDPKRPGQPNSPITETTGGNSALKPQKAATYDVGIVFTPRWLPQMVVNASYYHYHVTQQIVTPSVQQLINWEAQFPDRVQRGAPTVAGLPGAITALNLTPVNVAALVTDGIDLKANYALPAPSAGRIDLSMEGTFGLNYRTQAGPGSPFVEQAGNIGTGMSTYPPVDFRGRMGVDWSKGRFSAGWAGRYTSHFATTTTVATPAFPTNTGYDGGGINASFVMDLQFGYSIPYGARGRHHRLEELLGGTKWTVGCLNLLDRRPSYLSDPYGWYSLFDDPRQRYVYFQVRKSL